MRNLPSSPGVYLMKDSLGSILYVGKSKNIKKRVQSYFTHSKSHAPKVKKLVNHLRALEYITTDTEFEALMLECNLIQNMKPMYNRRMKNPLAYTYLMITQMDGLRRIEITNNPSFSDGHLCFGPYTANKNAVERAVQGILECFKMSCSHSYAVKSKTPCLNYSIGLCIGMCLGGDAVEKYNQMIDRMIALLDGSDRGLYEEMERMMLEASEDYDFEKAAKYRDDIEAVNFLLKKEKVLGFTEESRNIVVAEYVGYDTVKLFLIKRNIVLACHKYALDRIGITQLHAEIKAHILNHFQADRNQINSKVNRNEVDQAQIIYSYLQSSASHHIFIPEEWLYSKDQSDLDQAIQTLV